MSDANTTTTPNTPAGGAEACPERQVSAWALPEYGRAFMKWQNLFDFLRPRMPSYMVEDYAASKAIPLYTTPPATVPLDAVRGLVAKWRDAAENETRNGRNPDWAEWVREQHLARAYQLRSCADELEALTRGGK